MLNINETKPLSQIIINYQPNFTKCNIGTTLMNTKLLENVNIVYRFKFGVYPEFTEYLESAANSRIQTTFDDYYYYSNLMKENTWVKKRVENGNEEWIVKYPINDHQSLEERYDSNPFPQPLENVAKATMVRVSYNLEDLNSPVNIDRVTFPEGDVFCCGSYDILSNLNEYSCCCVRSTLLEYLYRYNPKLYMEMESIYHLARDYSTCILPDQYLEMEKKGDAEYYRLFGIIQGINWHTEEELIHMKKEMTIFYTDYIE